MGVAKQPSNQSVIATRKNTQFLVIFRRSVKAIVADQPLNNLLAFLVGAMFVNAV